MQKPSRELLIRTVITLVLIIAALGASGKFAQFLHSQRPGVEKQEVATLPLNVDVYETQAADFRELLTGFGTARADLEVTIAAQVGGEIVEVHPQLKVGTAVNAAADLPSAEGPSASRPGDLLVRIDPRDYTEQVNVATNRIEEAKTEIERLQVRQQSLARQKEKSLAVLATLTEEYQRLKTGVARQVSTPTELNRALLEVQRYEDTIIQLENQIASLPHELTAARQRLQSAIAEKARAEHNLQRTRVLPPFSGVISEVFVEQGQFVRAGEPLVRLIDMSRVEVPVPLAFEDFLLLQDRLVAGERPLAELARTETEAARWKGYVVRTAPEADTQSRTMMAYVEVQNVPESPALLPGSFVNVRIEGTEYRHALLIPRDAVVDDSVFVVDEQSVARRKTITIGRRLQSLVLVTDGLQSGDRVVLTNLDIVENGRALSVQSAITLADEMRKLRAPMIRLLPQ